MARPFDQYLHILFPGALGEFAQRVEFGELRLVIGVGDGAGAQAVAQRIGDVIGLNDLGDPVEMIVEERFLMMGEAPFRHDRSAATNEYGDALSCTRDNGQPSAHWEGVKNNALE